MACSLEAFSIPVRDFVTQHCSSYHFFHEGQIESQSSSEVGPFIELTNFTPNTGIFILDKEISPTDISVLLVGPIFIFSNGCVENKLSINSVGSLPLRNIHFGLVLVSKSDAFKTIF